jgi:hypothetical protein
MFRAVGRIEAKVDKVLTLLSLLITEGKKTMTVIDDLTAAVARETTVDSSIITLIQGLSARVAAATDMTQVAAIVTQINAQTDALAAAVIANTPVTQAAATTAPPATPATKSP